MKITRLNIGTRLNLGFGIMICALLGTNLYLLDSMNRLSSLTMKLYRHPFAVSTSVVRVELGVTKMHRTMRDVVLVDNPSELNDLVNTLEQDEQEVLQDFKILEERFLGDLNLVYKAQEEFVNWKPIRDQVIVLMRNNQKEAAIKQMKLNSRTNVNEILLNIKEVRDFAQNKAEEFVQSAEAAKNRALIATIVVMTVTSGLMIYLAVLLTRSITLPLQKAIRLNHRIANGELDLEIQAQSNDEIGQLLESMQYMVEQVKQVVLQVQRATENVSYSSQKMNHSALQMSQGATEQAAATEQASTSIQDMSQKIQQNSQNASQTNSIAMQAVQDAEASGKAVQETANAMKEIVQKIKVIEEIALQTNMLSLNAAIEASRAHEGNNGFGIVAAEVRKLAERSRVAAIEINQLAASSVAISEKAGIMLVQLIPSIQQTAQLVQQISVASQEQSQNTGQLNQAISQLDQVTQQNAVTSSELSSMSQSLSAQAAELQQAIAFFKLHLTSSRVSSTETPQTVPSLAWHSLS